MSASEEDDSRGFLARWSKRKLAPEDARAADDIAESVAAPAEEAALPAVPDAEPFDISLLPSIEDLTGESEVSMFMQSGVPEALKNAALRKIWSANPFFRDDTGPVDYGWDFNDPNSMPGFGPIGDDTDIASLLRQAIGEVEPVVEAPIDIAGEIAPEIAAPAMPQPDAEALASAGPAPEGEETPAKQDLPVAEQLPPPAAEASPAREVADALQAPRRPRHGGAVPA